MHDFLPVMRFWLITTSLWQVTSESVKKKKNQPLKSSLYTYFQIFKFVHLCFILYMWENQTWVIFVTLFALALVIQLQCSQIYSQQPLTRPFDTILCIVAMIYIFKKFISSIESHMYQILFNSNTTQWLLTATYIFVKFTLH